jgi:hypothetical protein
MISHVTLAAISITLVVAIPVLLYAFAMFDRLVRAEYEEHRSAWEGDGRPLGFFWHAPECTLFRSHRARYRLSFVWLFTTPAWVAPSVVYREWLRRLRICVLAWNVIILGLFVAVALVVLK